MLAADRESVLEFMSKGLSADRADVSAALSAVGFTAALQSAAVSELSGGWRMRMAIARSMLCKVDILILDEPTNHLDGSAVAWLREYLTTKLPGVTMLMVSHDASFLEAASSLKGALSLPARSCSLTQHEKCPTSASAPTHFAPRCATG